MLGFGALTLAERAAMSRAMLAMMRLGRAGRLALEGVSFGQWLDEHRQPASLVSKLYDAILIGSLNEDPRKASASYAIQVFQDALLSNSAGYVLGLPNCPLGKLYEPLPCKDVRLGTRVSELIFAESRITGVKLQSGEVFSADAVVLATNYHAVQRWVPQALQDMDDRFQSLDQLQSVPILGACICGSTGPSFSTPMLHFSRDHCNGSSVKTPRARSSMASSVPPVTGSIFPAKRPSNNLNRKSAARFPLPATRNCFVASRSSRNEPPSRRCREPRHFARHQRRRQRGFPTCFLPGITPRPVGPRRWKAAVRAGYLAAEAVMDRLASSKARFVVEDLAPMAGAVARPQTLKWRVTTEFLDPIGRAQ